MTENPEMLPAAARRSFDAAGEALRLTSAAITTRFGAALALLETCPGKVVVTGVGKSGLAARKLAATFASTGRSSFFLNASDALHGDLGMVGAGDVVVMLSNNAATEELLRMLPSLRKIGASVLGIFGREDTELARACDVVLPVIVSAEGCPLNLAPMASTLASIAVGDALAAVLMEKNGFGPDDFALRHPGGSLGRRLLLTAADVMQKRENVSILPPESDLRALVAGLTRHPWGAVCISADGTHLAGVVSDGDIRRAIMRDHPFELRASEIMSANPVTLRPEMNLGEVLGVLENPQRRIYVAPVVSDDSAILGLVRMHDIVG